MELVVKNLPVNAGDVRDASSISENSGSSRYKPGRSQFFNGALTPKCWLFVIFNITESKYTSTMFINLTQTREMCRILFSL